MPLDSKGNFASVLHMKLQNILFLALSLPLSGFSQAAETLKPEAPKAVVLIYADDLGYGDIGCNGAKAIPTPNIDKLAAEGLRNTSAYCTSATCTPSRYALMTGEYPWRRKGTGVLPGDAALIIPPATLRATLPSIMKQAGYKTCAIGKWHLGLGKGDVNWNEPIKYGLNEVGFDDSFIMAATADRVPCVFIDNGKVKNLDPKDPIEVSYKKNFPNEPTGKDNPEMLRWKASHGHNQSIVDGIGRIGYMKGGKSALWKDQDLADVLTDAAVQFIEKNKDGKFFMYFAPNDIHVPRDPHKRFIGKSGCGIRGDVTVQLDHCVGRIMEALKKNGLDKDTLVIFSSDNGPVIDDGYHDGAVENLKDHKPAGDFRGGKYSLMEGGTRIPFITRWSGKITPGTTTDSVVSQMDIAPSLAALAGQSLAPESFPDAKNVLPALLDAKQKGREEIVIHGMGMNLALRQGNMKYYTPNSIQRTALSGNKSDFEKVGPEGALYDLSKDPGEKVNIINDNQELAKKMDARLTELRGDAPQKLLGDIGKKQK